MTNSFSTFNIKHVPRLENFDVDLLANTTSRLILPEGLSPQTFSIELMYRPSIPDNVTSWKVFDDDHQILDFLSAQNTFKGMAINEADQERSLFDPSNIISKCVISLEKFYDLQYKFRQTINCKTQRSTLNHTPVNLEKEHEPRFINLGIHCSHDERRSFIKLCREYKYIFS